MSQNKEHSSCSILNYSSMGQDLPPSGRCENHMSRGPVDSVSKTKVRLRTTVRDSVLSLVRVLEQWAKMSWLRHSEFYFIFIFFLQKIISLQIILNIHFWDCLYCFHFSNKKEHLRNIKILPLFWHLWMIP